MKQNAPKQWIEVSSRNEWADWLDTNHQTEDGVWLRINKKSAQLPGVCLAEAVTEAIRYGWIDSRMYSMDENSYLLRFTPRRSTSVWSKINRERAEELINNNLMTPAGQKSIEEAKKSGNWQNAYSSKKPPVIPVEIRDRLKRERMYDTFTKLSNSHQLQYLLWIDQAKRETTKQDRIDRMIELIKQQ